MIIETFFKNGFFKSENNFACVMCESQFKEKPETDVCPICKRKNSIFNKNEILNMMIRSERELLLVEYDDDLELAEIKLNETISEYGIKFNGVGYTV